MEKLNVSTSTGQRVWCEWMIGGKELWENLQKIKWVIKVSIELHIKKMKRNILGFLLICSYPYSNASSIKKKLLRKRNHIEFSFFEKNDIIHFNISASGERENNFGVALAFEVIHTDSNVQ